MEMGIGYHTLFMLNNYERYNIELNVRSLRKQIDHFKRLSEITGKESVISRFDPTILIDL